MDDFANRHREILFPIPSAPSGSIVCNSLFPDSLFAVSSHVPFLAVSARLNPDLHATLEQIIAKALEKDRDLRYQHAGDIRSDLRRLKREQESGQISVPGPMPGGVPSTKNLGRSLFRCLRLYWPLPPLSSFDPVGQCADRKRHSRARGFR
jgi:hypothetical protein